ncbi:MAG: ATP-binding protein [Actinomycetota bacterium]
MKGRNRSLRLRLTLLATAMVAVVLAFSSFLLVRWVHSSQLDDADRTLSDQIDLVQGLIKTGSLPTVLKPTGVTTGQVQVISSGIVVAVSPGLASSVRLDVFAAPVVGLQVSRTTTAAALGVEGRDRYRVVARTVSSGIGPLTVYTASSLHAPDQAVRTLELSLIIGLPILVAFAAITMWFVVGRALRPVDEMRREVDAIRASGDQRLNTDRNATELDQLAVTFNDMLDRISAAEATRRQFLADASHELRSPLASARTMLEVGLAYPELTDWPTTATEVMVEVERLQAMAGELLALARVEGGERALSRESFDLGTLVAAEVQRYADPRINLTVTHPMEVEVDRVLFVRAVRNLLDNALRHARERIDVTVVDSLNGAPGHPMADVVVRNDGEPIAGHERERIFEPFTRLDDGRSRDEGGAGLGLSIARRIAEVHGGSVSALADDDGATFVLRLPHTA